MTPHPSPPMAADQREGHRVSPDVIEYRDDDCQGFVFRVVRGNDGDFHLSFAPDQERLERADRTLEHCDMKATDFPWFRISVRICTHAGGGRYSHLYQALADLWRAESMYDR